MARALLFALHAISPSGDSMSVRFRLPTRSLWLSSVMLIAAAVPSHAGLIGQNSGQFDASIQAFKPIGQSFVAEDKYISSIGLAFSDINPGLANEPVTMRLTDGAGIGGALVKSVTKTLPAVLPSTISAPQLIDFDFSGAVLTVGHSYTVSVTVPTSFKVAVVYSGTDVYAGGQAYESSPSLDLSCTTTCDLNFEVIPSPVQTPSSTVGNSFVFTNPRPRLWFDPPLADGFQYDLIGGGDFLEVDGVPGFLGLDVKVNGLIVDANLNPGDSYFFDPGVTSFSLLGIAPPVDGGDPTAFPTFLDFSGSPTELRMTPIVVAAGVPEPGTLTLFGVALLALGAMRRREKPAGGNTD
jgi:PEP-CTERM motif-containing protein